MKQLITFIFCLLLLGINAQEKAQLELKEGSLKAPIIEYGVLTQAEIDNLTLSSNQRGTVWNITTNTKQDWNGTAWVDAVQVATYSATSTATTTLDLDTFDSLYQILTVNTDIVWSNTPSVGETVVKTLRVIGAFSLSFSTADNIIGTYNDDGTTLNIITVEFSNYPTIGLTIDVLINN